VFVWPPIKPINKFREIQSKTVFSLPGLVTKVLSDVQ
jgi:hypothetical protein